MCQTRSHYALAFPMIRVLVTVADRLCASAGPLCVSRGQEQDGSEALAAWAPGRYAAVLADLHMPGMDGFELTR